MKRQIKGKVSVGQVSYTPLAYVNQLDDIILELDIYCDSISLDVTGQIVSLYAKRSNKTVVEQIEGFTIDKSKITVQVKNSCFAVPGITELQLELIDSDGKATTSSFYITVNKSLSSEDSIVAGNEIAILAEAKKMEPIRQENELERVNKETARVQSETNRAAAETGRVEAEKLRAQAETTREGRLKEVEVRSSDNATQIADIANNLQGANIDQNGVVQPTLDKRLDEDYAIVMDRFNKASLLPYESEFISANNSYKGMTKELVVKGKTLQNLLDVINISNSNKDIVRSYIYENNSLKNQLGTDDSDWINLKGLSSLIKQNTKYSIVAANLTTVSTRIECRFNKSTPQTTIVLLANESKTIKIDSGTDGIDFYLKFYDPERKLSARIQIMLLEGDYTNKPIPSYFEGIKSVNEDEENLEVVSCGKNLWNYTLVVGTLSSTDGSEYDIDTSKSRTSYIPVLSNKSYALSCKTLTDVGRIHFYNRTKWISSTTASNFTTPTNCTHIRVVFIQTVQYMLNQDIQLEINTVKTTYEPYTEHRLPIKMKNLRGLGNVCDTSDGVRRVGKFVVDGSEPFMAVTSLANNDTMYFGLGENLSIEDFIPIDEILVDNNGMICNEFKLYNCYDGTQTEEGFCKHKNTTLMFRVKRTRLTEQSEIGFGNWLRQKYDSGNPIIVYYPLKTPITEQIFTEQLRTYDGTTNIFTDGSLIEPTISFKIPSNVQAVVMNLKEENRSLQDEVQATNSELDNVNISTMETNLDQECRLTMLELGL